MAVVIWVTIKLTAPFDSHFSKHLNAAFQLSTGLVCGGIAYFLGAWLLKMDELHMLLKIVKSKF